MWVAAVAWNWIRVIAITLTIFVIVFVFASLLMRELEESCSETCSAQGYSAYEYTIYSGAGHFNLGPDSCTCSTKPDAKP